MKGYRSIVLHCLGLPVLFLLFFAGASWAADQPTAQPRQVPAEQEQEEGEQEKVGLPVLIEHDGTDPVGLRLAFHLKETFQKSSLFRLAGPEEKHFSLRLVTREQFRDRPYLGSVYALVWRYVESREVLAYSLGERLGFADADAVAQEAEVIAAETDRVKGRYGYLLE
jgi:hypothetical protein